MYEGSQFQFHPQAAAMEMAGGPGMYLPSSVAPGNMPMGGTHPQAAAMHPRMLSPEQQQQMMQQGQMVPSIMPNMVIQDMQALPTGGIPANQQQQLVSGYIHGQPAPQQMVVSAGAIGMENTNM